MTKRRVVIKVSGEGFGNSGQKPGGISGGAMSKVVSEIASISRQVELVITVGGGNYVRGSDIRRELLLHPETADFMGMTSTVLNALALRDMLELMMEVPAVIVSKIAANAEIGQAYNPGLCLEHLRGERVVILAGGTGRPGVTTDTGAAQLAQEIGASVLWKATKVGGIYTADPATHPDAQLIERITYREVIQRGLGFMDPSAIEICEARNIPIQVFNMYESGALVAALDGRVGSLVTSVAT